VSIAAWLALARWRVDPLPVATIALAALVYARGWRMLRRQMPERFPPWRLAAFLAGLAALLLAIASPIDALAAVSLSLHMLQHLLLTMVAPPLLWLGAPAIPLLRGLPRALARDALGPFLAWPALRRGFRTLTHPVAGFAAFVAALWLWHVPSLYELALASRGWHVVEHASFVAGALLFWWPVVQPWPSVPHWARWAMLPYLALADLLNTVFAAVFAFSDRVLYPTYASAPRLLGGSALADQALAGAIMWVPGQVAFLVPAALILSGLLSPRAPAAAAAMPTRAHEPSAALRPARFAAVTASRGAAGRRLDVLAVPVLGPILRAGVVRRAAQATLLVVALAVVVDGLRGPQMSPMNLAGLLPWTVFRGASVIALLVAGNLFCFACPFMLPRAIAKRLLPAARRWPRALRSKWLAVALLVALLAAYEAFDPWDAPRWTAWIVVVYFAAAFAIDGVFRGAAFCKYVCPIGQFQFATASLSPLEVAVREPATCASCTTHDCLRGHGALGGCETDLFLPRKAGSLDCTFCLDCARACPHDNVGLLAVVPASDLARDARRSSFGRLSRRPDVAALALVLVFGAFANAAGMIAPAARLEEALAAALGPASPRVATAAWIAASVVALPALAALACAGVARALAGGALPVRELVCRFALALLPLGVAMWAAHVVFHLVTGAGAVLPALQRALLDAGIPLAGRPDWAAARAAAPEWLLPAKLALLDAGFCLTVVTGWRIARQLAERARPALALLAPWAGLAAALWVAGVWILVQPMEMRGTMVH